MPMKKCPKPFKLKDVGRGTVHREKLIEKLEQKPKDYYKVAQLLKWEDDGWSVRFGYYIKPHGAKDDEWQWGSQTTSIIGIENLRELMNALANLMETYEKIQKRDRR